MPNLQIITKKCPEVKTLREAFLKQVVGALSAVDYGPAEARILAHLNKECPPKGE